MPDDVSDLNAGKSRQEVVSGEVQTGVASVADIDRSAELLIWVFQSLFGKKKQAQEEGQESARNSKGAAAAAVAKGAFQVATFGGGCFWCSEAVFSEVRGVVSTRCGYAGGKTAEPTYEDVSSGLSGHAEVVEVTFDNGVVSYRDLLKVFMASHDPTSDSGQGDNVGPQYRSIIVCHSEQQAAEAAQALADAGHSGRFERRTPRTQLVTAPPTGSGASHAAAGHSAHGDVAAHFQEAEDRHQQYFDRNANDSSYCSRVIVPKLKQLMEDPHVAHLFAER